MPEVLALNAQLVEQGNSRSCQNHGILPPQVSFQRSSFAALIEEEAQPSLQPFPTHYHPRVSLGT